MGWREKKKSISTGIQPPETDIGNMLDSGKGIDVLMLIFPMCPEERGE